MMGGMNDDAPPPIEIPFSRLSADAQDGVIDDFISREGTDYGWHEASLENKRAQVRAQIEDGRVKLVFDPSLESVTLLTVQDWKKARPAEAAPD